VDSLLRNIDDKGDRIKELKLQREAARRDLSELKPGAVRDPLLALGGVFLAGIVLPVVIMAMRWPHITAPWRWTLVGAFLGSVMGVGVYMARFARSLTTREESDQSVASLDDADEVARALIEESTAGSLQREER
jgi:hypothetical protein